MLTFNMTFKHLLHFNMPVSSVLTCLYLVRPVGDVTTQVSLQAALKFNGGGHINHTIFWTNLSPNGGGEPQGKEEIHTQMGTECPL